MVVLAASICTRGGKAVLSRQFREIPRSRIEALLASFPKLADSGTQHTTVEQDNVRFVYQPLDELYIVLITNKQSNILQDIDSLHLFAQVVTNICKSLDELEILRNAFELLSAFDEIVTLGYRENLTLSQIKTFLEMESHDERISEIIERNKELEASEERKRKAKQLEMQRREAARWSKGAAVRPPSYPVYNQPARPSIPDTIDSYEAEKKKTFAKPLPSRSKGMQLGKKSKTTDIYEKVRGDLGPEAEATPLISATPTSAAALDAPPSRLSLSADREPVHITVAETVSAKLSRDGAMKSFEVKGDLQLRISDPSFTKLKLDLKANPSHGAQFRTHPNVDKALFASTKSIQLKDTSKRFPANNSIGVLRWRVASNDDTDLLPITFTVWINKGSDSTTMTIEYELTGSESLRDVVVTIPFQTAEPNISSFDAVYEVSGDSIDWNIGNIDESNNSGSFEFESTNPDGDENEFFPMSVRFSKDAPFVDVDVLNVSLMEMEGEGVNFSKDIKCIAEGYIIE
ncbi:coatomer subunit delta [Ophidiomyces ophidiicola]|nr:coatomer subunit delta [Ophidiomyces ophidiicola]KAI1920818.1 coatomer subunit delta [Ophidiomyces ophidiicola]KAI1928865.1 coatomer subunit delta [Ophidiomyces ophidiicola]KAI1936265.1 coatomer subunit delta [Ophidiomyces ophidiicola]KAI1956210.1 coatomer subunit delta [Ophidiomyces ophidiicola]